MENGTKQIPVGTMIFWGQTATGIFWIGAGISGMFDTLICTILNVLFLAAGLVAFGMVFRFERTGDDGDEMAEYHYLKAKADAGSIMHLLLGLAAIASVLFFRMLQEANMDWPQIVSQMIFVLMGIHNTLIGLIFRKLEAE